MDKERLTNLPTFLRMLRRPRIAFPAIGIIILIILGTVWYFNRQSKIIWAKDVALPQIEKLVDYSWRDYSDAYKLEEVAEKYIPQNQKLAKFIAESSRKININTEPEGAEVYFKPYSQPSEDWKIFRHNPN